jgi:nitrile hydratase
MPRGHHDIGGTARDAGPIDRSEHQLDDWEVVADAVNQALGVRGIKRTDELRRAREEMDSELYRSLGYYERWIASMESILIEKKILSREEIDRKVAEIEKKWGEP